MQVLNSSFDGIDFRYGAMISYLSPINIQSSIFSNSQGGIYCEFGSVNISDSSFSDISTNLFSPVYIANAMFTVNNVNFTDGEGNAGGLLFIGGSANFTIHNSQVNACSVFFI